MKRRVQVISADGTKGGKSFLSVLEKLSFTRLIFSAGQTYKRLEGLYYNTSSHIENTKSTQWEQIGQGSVPF
jgi:hypothetical protein